MRELGIMHGYVVGGSQVDGYNGRSAWIIDRP